MSERTTHDISFQADKINSLNTELTTLRAEVAALKEDKERLDWAIEFPNTFTKVCSDACGGTEKEELARTRLAIDAARKKNK